MKGKTKTARPSRVFIKPKNPPISSRSIPSSRMVRLRVQARLLFLLGELARMRKSMASRAMEKALPRTSSGIRTVLSSAILLPMSMARKERTKQGTMKERTRIISGASRRKEFFRMSAIPTTISTFLQTGLLVRQQESANMGRICFFLH